MGDMSKSGALLREVEKMIQRQIRKLVDYGLQTGLIGREDEIYTINRLLELFGLDEWNEELEKTSGETVSLDDILGGMLDYAADRGLLGENTITYRDLFDTKIMAVLMPRPSEVRERFWGTYHEQGARAATDYFYRLSGDSNYIRRDRVKKDLKWTTDTEFGTLDITINLSKPEKDP